MELSSLFEQAVANSKNLPVKPANAVLLQLYALYKQATEGNLSIDPPSNSFDFVARAKYNAWEELKGKSKEVAMQEYIDLIEKMT